MDELVPDKEYDIFEVYGGKHRGKFICYGTEIDLVHNTKIVKQVLFEIDGLTQSFLIHLVHWKLIV